MSAYILHVETGVPGFSYSQEFTREKMKSWAVSKHDARLIHHVHKQSGILNRYSVCGDFASPDAAELFTTGADGQLSNPGTQERNDVFAREARKLAVEVAGRALAACPEIRREEVTHVVTVTCTGFSNPGMDFHLVTDLGLNPSTQRYQLGFMGCYAAFPALRMAQQFCLADPRAVVLVLCLEFCTLHIQVDGRADSILANALFADGAACAIIHGRDALAGRSAYRLNGFTSGLAPGGEKDMAWSIGNHGFNIVLSSYVPDIIAANIADIVNPVLAGVGFDRDDIDMWAVHPGGKAILDKIGKGLSLPEGSLAISRSVLERFGNMSSATILFVLRDLLASESAEEEKLVCALAFGPGLTIEMGLLHALPRFDRRQPLSFQDCGCVNPGPIEHHK